MSCVERERWRWVGVVLGRCWNVGSAWGMLGLSPTNRLFGSRPLSLTHSLTHTLTEETENVCVKEITVIIYDDWMIMNDFQSVGCYCIISYL